MMEEDEVELTVLEGAPKPSACQPGTPTYLASWDVHFLAKLKTSS